jgi:hypothetical protein
MWEQSATSIAGKRKGQIVREDLAFRFSNIMKMGMQRFCALSNLACQILQFTVLKQFSLTINNYHAIKTC